MKVQLKELNTKYGYKRVLDKLDEDQVKEIEEILLPIIEATPINRDYDIVHYVRLLKPLSTALYKTGQYEKNLFSNVMLSYLLTKQENVKWINCSCGSSGKFRRLS